MISKLEYQIQRVLPTVYDDSLSWYELVNKVVQKLNDVIDQSNEFVSQDMQVFTENVLTQWKADGTLDSVINQSIFNDLNTKVDTSLEKVELKEVKDKLYKKHVFKEIPLYFPDYNQIIAQEGNEWLYPQSFTIDWEGEELFLLYEPSLGTTKRWVVVRDLNDLTYKGCFHAGDSGGEGIVVKYENNNRYLYVKYDGTGTLGKYAINTLPPNRTSLAPAQTFNVGLAFDFSYRDGLWLIEQGDDGFGTYQRRTVFAYYDDNFNKMGTITIPTEIGGYFNSEYADYIPKRQSIALHDEMIIQGTGGSWRVDDVNVIPYGYQGITLLHKSGELLQEGLMRPDWLISELQQKGFYSDRVETEGVHVDENGNVYTMMIHLLDITDLHAQEAGILIFQEMYEGTDVWDFKNTAHTFTRINSLELGNKPFPSHHDGNLYNPYTGVQFTTLDEIMDFMIGVELGSFSFYSNEVGEILDNTGSPVPANTFVEITNTNNYTFILTYKGDATSNEWVVYGNSGSRTVAETNTQNHKLTLNNGSSVYEYGTDLNTLQTSGYFYIDSGAPNNPNGTYGFLFVMSSATTCIQVFHPVTNNEIYRRSFNAGSWGAWGLITSTG